MHARPDVGLPTSLHQLVEQGSVDEVEEVGEELGGDLLVELTVLEQLSGLLQNLQDLLRLPRDQQTTAAQELLALPGHWLLAAPLEGVTFQQAW